MNAPRPVPLRFALASVIGAAGIVLASGVEFLTRGALTSLEGVGLVGPLLVGVATLGILATLWLSILRLRGTRVSMAILLTPIVIAVFSAALATRLDPPADAPDTLGLRVAIERSAHLSFTFLGCAFAAVMASVAAWCVAIDALARCEHRKPAAAGATAVIWFGMAVLGIFAGLSLSDEAVGIPGSLGVPHLGAALAAVVAALGLGSGDDDVRGRALRDGLAVTALGLVATYSAAYAAATVDLAQLALAMADDDAASRLLMADRALAVIEEELVVATCLTLAPLAAMLVPLFTCRDVFASAVQTRPALSGAALLALLAIMGAPPVLHGMTHDELVASVSGGLLELPEVSDVHLPLVAAADEASVPSPEARVVTVGTESVRDGDVVVGPRTLLNEGADALRRRLGAELSETTVLLLDEGVSVAELYVLLDALTQETTARFEVIVEREEQRAFTGAMAGMRAPPFVVPLLFSSSLPRGAEYALDATGLVRRAGGRDTRVELPLEIDRGPEPGWISASEGVSLVRVLTALSLLHTGDDVIVSHPTPRAMPLP